MTNFLKEKKIDKKNDVVPKHVKQQIVGPKCSGQYIQYIRMSKKKKKKVLQERLHLDEVVPPVSAVAQNVGVALGFFVISP